MATALENERIIGGIGIVAVVVFIAAMFVAALMKSDFSFGSGTVGDLTSETAFVAGCVIAGALGALFGLLITYKKVESKVFIGKIRGLLMILSGAALAAVGLTYGNIWTVYMFIVLITLAAASDMFYDWVADQKILMVFSLFLTLVIALAGILSQTSDNNILGFVFILFVSVWVLLVAAMRFAPIVEAEPEKSKKKDKKRKTQEREREKKNTPAPKPYPAKKEPAPAPRKAATEKPVYREEVKKADVPKKAEQPKPAEPEVKEEQPKLKVMSSREAAAARDARKKEEPEVHQPKPEPAAEVKPPAGPAAESIAETDAEAEEYYEDFEITEDTPDALLRRATWNKGLRCRRDYGEHKVPIAFVKARVAVYVMSEKGDTSIDDKLRAEGWTVFRYLESEISDGREQAEEINKAVKENLKAERTAKKKKSFKR